MDTNSYQAGGRHIICDMFKVNINKLECITSNTYETFDKFIINTLVDAKINLLTNNPSFWNTWFLYYFILIS